MLVIYTVVYPTTTAPRWIGPLYLHNVTYLGTGPFTDFHFICRVNTPHQMNETARFEVFLMFDSRMSSVKRTVTSASLDVVFSSHDISSGFGTKVWQFSSLLTLYNSSLYVNVRLTVIQILGPLLHTF